MRRAALLLATVLLGAVSLAGCGTSSAGPAPSASVAPSTATGSQPIRTDGDITVFAAASLTKTFTELGDGFARAYPGTKVRFSFAGSSDLATQLTAGAPADVFAAANPATMATVVDAGLAAGEPVDFATNTLEIVTPPGNPAAVTSFADLGRPGLSVVVCAPQVPCGAATEQVSRTAGVTLAPVSEESSVTDVLGKVTSGQADAGVVYVTDARGAGAAVEAVPFPQAARAVNVYPAVGLADSAHRGSAAAFLDYLTSTDARTVLTRAGFGPP